MVTTSVCRQVLEELRTAVQNEWLLVSKPQEQWKALEAPVLRPVAGSTLFLSALDLDDKLFEGSQSAVRLDGVEFRAEVVGLAIGELLLRIDNCTVTEATRCEIRVPVPSYLESLGEFLEECLASMPADADLAPGPALATAMALEPDRRGTLAERIGYVIGPPGSGKTTALMDQVMSLTRQGQRAAVVTYTNAAADLVFSRLAGRLQPGADFKLCRFGITDVAQQVELDADAGGVFATDQVREIEDANVLVTTAYRALVCCRNGIQPFDHVLIDEASTMPISLAWVTASLAIKSISIYGDPFQLGPIAQSENDPESTLLQRFGSSPFDIPGLLDGETVDDHISVLQRQFRMPPALSSASAVPLYRRESPTDNEYSVEPTSPWGSRSLLHLNTAAIGAIGERASKSRRNAKHVDVVVEVIRLLLEQNVIEPEAAADSLLVITPYRLQRSDIHRALHSTGWFDEHQIRRMVTTIHRAQGQERDFVILDITDAPSGDPTDHSVIGRLWGGTGWQSGGARLLTTALSRARQQALVIMHRGVTGTAEDPYDPNARPLARLNALLNVWGEEADIRL